MKKFKGKKMPDGGKLLRYEKVKSANGSVYLSPVFDGNWSDFDKKNAWKSIPDNMSGVPVMKGENYMDISKGVVSNGPVVIQEQQTPQWGQNIIQDHAGTVHYQAQMPNQWSQQTPLQRENGGSLPLGNYGMSMTGFSNNIQQGFQNGYNMQQGNPYQLDEANVSASRMNTMQPAPMHMMATPQQQFPTPQQVDPNQTLDGGSTGMPTYKPKRNQRSFTTPGTGDLIAGAVGMANAFLPSEEQTPNYHKPQFGTYNPNSFGSGPQSMYEDGGFLPEAKEGFKLNPAHKGWCTPMSKSTCTGKRRQFAINAKNHFKKQEDGGMFPGGTHNVKRKIGGFSVTEEVPNMLGKYPIVKDAPLPNDINPAQVNSIPMPKSISYESWSPVTGGIGGEYLSPVFKGFSPSEIRNQWGSIPTRMHGKEVLRGQAWQDVQQQSPYNDSPLFMNTPQYQPINYRPSYGGIDNSWDSGSMEMGGKLAKGNKVKLTASQKLALEAKGYKFE